MSEMPKQPIEIAIENLQEAVGFSSEIRNVMIQKLRTEINNLEINAMNSGAALIEAKLGIYKTLDDLLKSNVADANTVAKAVLGKKAEESQQDARAAAIEVLKLVGLRDLPGKNAFQSDPNGDDKLQATLEKAQETNPELKISEEEKTLIK